MYGNNVNNNNEFSKLKLSSELLGTFEVNSDNRNILKRNYFSSFTSVKSNNEYNGVNQFTITSFNNFKNNKGNLSKTDMLLIPGKQKDTCLNGNSTKNYWTTDIRNNASPTRISVLNAPSNLKNFANKNHSKNIK